MIYPNKSVSSDTHRNEDLLQAFASELENAVIAAEQIGERSAASYAMDKRLAGEAFALVEQDDCDSETASEIVTELFDRLNEYAPDGCAFGANEGDGADFGFWQINDGED